MSNSMNKPNNNNSIQHENSTPDKCVLVTDYPAISEQALLHKHTRYYDVWLCLREVYKHQGNCSLAQGMHLITSQFDITNSAAYKIIREGNGIFWNLNPKHEEVKSTIWIVSIEKVCRRYGITKCRQSVIIDLRDRHSVQERRAGIYEAAIVKQPVSKAIPVSRDNITKRTGVSKSTQLNYEKRWKAEKQYNYMVVCELDGLTEEQQYSRILDFTDNIHGEYQVREIHGKKLLIKQIPNLYFDMMFEYGEKSALKRLNKSLRDTDDTIASAITQERVHPYVDSTYQTIVGKMNLWSGKVTLNYKINHFF